MPMSTEDKKRPAPANLPFDNGPPKDGWAPVPTMLKLIGIGLALWGIYYMAANLKPSANYMTAYHGIPANYNGTPVERGKYYFQTKGCMSCHTVDGYGGTLGPNLSHVASWHLPAGFFKKWLANPSKVMPGATMPKLPLSKAEINDLAAYLRSLK